MAPQRKKIAVYLNVYDLARINDYAYWTGLGIFHSGVEVLNREYSFGGHEYSFTGVFDVTPKHAPQAVFRETIFMGDCPLKPSEIMSLIEKLAAEYPGNTYNLVGRNCNHFSNELCSRLVGRPIPRYINRLANWGLFFNCVLPEGWGVPTPGSPTGRSNSSSSLQPARGSMRPFATPVSVRISANGTIIHADSVAGSGASSSSSRKDRDKTKDPPAVTESTALISPAAAAAAAADARASSSRQPSRPDDADFTSVS